MKATAMSTETLASLPYEMDRDWPDVEAALKRALTAEPDEWDPGVLHVSDLRHTLEGEGCPRQLWLRTRGAPAAKVNRPGIAGDSNS